MTHAHLTPRLRHAVQALFTPADAELAAGRLQDACSPETLAVSDARLLERIAAAAVKQSGGALPALDAALRLARQDWRDLLLAAGFGEDSSAHDLWLNGLTP